MRLQQIRNVSSYVGDASLYNGRSYLCWGSVPAVLLSIVKPALGIGSIGDELLVFAFVSGLFLVLNSAPQYLLPLMTLTALLAISSSQDRFMEGNPVHIQAINKLLRR